MQPAAFQEIHLGQKLRLALVIGLIVVLPSCIVSAPLPPSAQDNNADANQNFPASIDTQNSNTDNSSRVPDIAIATPQSIEQKPQVGGQDVAERLRDDAHFASEEGLYEKAERLLDRAIRIAPRDAENYYELAKLRLLQQQPSQAAQLARRGLSLHPSDDLYEKLKSLEAQASNTSS